jgi:tyrosine-protein phosphatase YwqE
MIQRIDVHSHLLPGVDDGCRDVAESVACARLDGGRRLHPQLLHAAHLAAPE